MKLNSLNLSEREDLPRLDFYKNKYCIIFVNKCHEFRLVMSVEFTKISTIFTKKA